MVQLSMLKHELNGVQIVALCQEPPHRERQHVALRYATGGSDGAD